MQFLTYNIKENLVQNTNHSGLDFTPLSKEKALKFWHQGHEFSHMAEAKMRETFTIEELYVFVGHLEDGVVTAVLYSCPVKPTDYRRSLTAEEALKALENEDCVCTSNARKRLDAVQPSWRYTSQNRDIWLVDENNTSEEAHSIGECLTSSEAKRVCTLLNNGEPTFYASQGELRASKGLAHADHVVIQQFHTPTCAQQAAETLNSFVHGES